MGSVFSSWFLPCCCNKSNSLPGCIPHAGEAAQPNSSISVTYGAFVLCDFLRKENPNKANQKSSLLSSSPGFSALVTIKTLLRSRAEPGATTALSESFPQDISNPFWQGFRIREKSRFFLCWAFTNSGSAGFLQFSVLVEKLGWLWTLEYSPNPNSSLLDQHNGAGKQSVLHTLHLNGYLCWDMKRRKGHGKKTPF